MNELIREGVDPVIKELELNMTAEEFMERLKSKKFCGYCEKIYNEKKN